MCYKLWLDSASNACFETNFVERYDYRVNSKHGKL